MKDHACALKRAIAAVSAPAQLELPFGARRISHDLLTKGRPVRAVALVCFTNSVAMRASRRGRSGVYVDGRLEGFYDRYGKMDWHVSPQTVEGVMVELSDQQRFMVHSHELVVIRGWQKVKSESFSRQKHWRPVKRKVMATAAKLRRNIWVSFEQACKLAPGDAVTVEYPFQWVKGNLTNGEVTFPPDRPHGRQWLEYPVPAVPADCWDDFLDGLEGKFLGELLPSYESALRRRRCKRQKQPGQSDPALTERQGAVARIVRGAMWKGDGCERVHIGRNVIFIAAGPDRKPLYLVDNPGVGALYLFVDEQEARRFAQGQISRSDAIASGARRIVHAGAWSERTARLVGAA